MTFYDHLILLLIPSTNNQIVFRSDEPQKLFKPAKLTKSYTAELNKACDNLLTQSKPDTKWRKIWTERSQFTTSTADQKKITQSLHDLINVIIHDFLNVWWDLCSPVCLSGLIDANCSSHIFQCLLCFLLCRFQSLK